ncbi:DNA primase family protein [Levilactobacillus brevis]|uniref:DNA primase family protein n=1 Tax=Levilactobacillus brevis TaxID=1580 RepID=UPI001118D656|nr:phage/plasmid primase, P4 family [Levilactobacillus brevis]QCZ44476.1 phage primase [Levilactobacillus brevis]
MNKGKALGNPRLNYIRRYVNPDFSFANINEVGDNLKISSFRKIKEQTTLFTSQFGFMGKIVENAWLKYMESGRMHEETNELSVGEAIEEFGRCLLQKETKMIPSTRESLIINHEGTAKFLLKIFAVTQLVNGQGLLIYDWDKKCYEHAEESDVLKKAIAALLNTITADGWVSYTETRILDLVGHSLKPVLLTDFDTKYSSFGGKLLNLSTLTDGGGADPNKLVLHYSDVVLDEKAQCPKFQRFLDEDLPDKQSQKFLQEYTGYLLDATNKAHAFLIIHGAGQNGKSVYLGLVTQLLGSDSVSAGNIEALGKDFGLSPLVGKLANISNEGEAVDFSTAQLKAITSGDPVQINPKNRDMFSLVLRTKFIFSTNNLPTTTDTSEGFARRLNILPFSVHVPKSMVDPDLPKKLSQELSGILNWAIEGLKRLRSNNYRFTKSGEMEDAKNNYILSNQPVRRFVKECFELRNGSKISFRDLRELYAKWLQENELADAGTLNKRVFAGKVKAEVSNIFNTDPVIVNMHGHRKGVSGFHISVEGGEVDER